MDSNFSLFVSVGVLYGLTTVVVGHPLDTLKTKMQGQMGFERSSMVQTFWKTLKTQGVRGLYRHVHLGFCLLVYIVCFDW